MRPFVDHPAAYGITVGMPEAAEGNRARLIALRVPRELDERLRAHVAETGSSISDVVRAAIERELAPAGSGVSRGTPAKAKRGSVSRCEHRSPSGSFCASCDGIVP